MESWYLLYCRRGQLSRAQEHLTLQHVPYFCPVTSTEKRVKGKICQVAEPLFPNYLFIRFHPEVIHTTTISATRGVSHFVRFGHQLAIVPDQVIAALQNQIHSPTRSCLSDIPAPGDNVLITDGELAGIQAILKEQDGETRSILLLKLLNKEVIRSMDNSCFQKC
ncbi:MAG: Transcription antitermination protein RfaH [Candidatus Erwinia impunctatus]|nr:Transcription antitermination protein RfaH [Culicoides impunctatus]